MTTPPPDPRRAAVAGLFGGLCWSAPFALLTFLACRRAMGDGPSALTAQLVVLVWALSAAAANVARALEAAKPLPALERRYRATVDVEVRKAAVRGTLFCAPVALYMLAATWGYGPPQGLFTASVVTGIWVGSAALVGLGRGQARAKLELFTAAPDGWPARYESVVRDAVWRAVRQAAWFAVPACLLFIGLMPDQHCVAWAAVLPTWLGSAAGVGANRGERAARAELAELLGDKPA